MSRDDTPEWPEPVPVVIGHSTQGMTSLSRLPTTDRARVFAALKTQQPEMADLVSRFGRRFGKLELYVDDATAEGLGVGQ